MAFDYKGFAEAVDEFTANSRAEREEKEKKPTEDAKPWYGRVYEWGSDVAGAAYNAGAGFVDAYGRYAGAEVERRKNQGEYYYTPYDNKEIYTPEVTEASRELAGATANLVLSPAGAAIAPIRDFVGEKIYKSAEEGSGLAQDLMQTETFVNYFMKDEDKLKKAREIEANTGIPADSFIDDDVAYKQALKIDDYKRKKRELMSEDAAMESVWKEFPEIRDIAKMNPRDAALALHDIESVRSTRSIIETFTHFLEVGNKRLELNNLGYKMLEGKADANDMQRAADLRKMLEDDKKELPSFFDDPILAIVGSATESLPQVADALASPETVRDGILMAGATYAAGAMYGAAAGTGVLPVAGTAAGGAVGGGLGAAGGFLAGAGRSVSGRLGMSGLRYALGQLASGGGRASGAAILQSAAGRNAIGRGVQIGTYEAMARQMSGEQYLELGEMKDKDGNALLSEDDRRFWAMATGSPMALIESASFGLDARRLLGSSVFAKEAIKAVVDNAKGSVARRESLSAFARKEVGGILKVAGAESAEEAAQSVVGDLAHNRIVSTSNGRAAYKVYNVKDMAANAFVASVSAFPAGLGFGIMTSAGSVPGIVRHARRMSSENVREDMAVQRTMTGTVMLERLQEVVSSAKLRQTAPDVQQKIIRSQVNGTGFETAYIDTQTAMEKENGLADLKEVAKTAGIENEQLEATIRNGGHLYVPVERYAQSAASPELLESVSFSPETDSIARVKKNAKSLAEAVEKAQKEAVAARVAIVDAITNEWFPEAPKHANDAVKTRRTQEREMAIAAIAQDQESPANGWRQLYKAWVAERDELLKPALDALRRGMGNGVDIVQTGEDGRGVRVSNNEPWYQDFYKKHGRAPRKSELIDLAYLLTIGDVNAPKVEGWIPSSKEEADAMAGAKGQLDELNQKIKTMENIKDRMMQVDAAEIRGSAGLSPEAYSVYRQIMAALKAMGGKQTKVARMNALIFAHHADQYARVIREKQGTEYTAMDYFKNTFGLRYGGKYTEEGDALQQAVREGLNLDEQVHVVNLDVLTNNLKGKTDQDILNYISKASLLPEVPTADFQALVGLPKDSDSYGQRHLVRGNANRSSDNRTARNVTLSNFADIAKNAVVVEVVPNAKKAPLTGLKGKKRQAQKRKNQISNYYRIMVPVQMNGHIKTLVIVAEEHDGVVSTGSVPVTAYEIYYAKKPPLAATPRPKTGVSAAEEEAPLTISIRDMLAGVKGADGNVYAQSMTGLSDIGLKEMQLRIIQETNPMHDDIHTGIRSVDDILTAKEAFEEKVDEDESYVYPDFTESDGKAALRSGKVTIYSSYPITPGVFVTPSKMQAQDYAENGKVYSKRGSVKDVAWINSDEGQYAPVRTESYQQSAWHGTPHNFERFLLSMIGTGEGAQTHGWGLYFAKNREVSEWYKDVLGGIQQNIIHAGDKTYVMHPSGYRIEKNSGDALQEGSSIEIALSAFEDNDGNVENAIRETTDYLAQMERIKDSDTRERNNGLIREALRILKEESNVWRLEKKKSSLYHVEIPDDGVLLDEQKTLKEQPKIAALLDRYGEEIGDSSYMARELGENMTGREIYEYISYTEQTLGAANGDKAASEYLNAAGIKGITYRGRQDGRCFVIFDDKAISIIEKFNQEMQKEVYGEIFKEQGKRIIQLFEGANESTMLHEMGHMFLMDLEELAKIDEASADDLATVNAWTEWKEGSAEEYKDTPWAEKFRAHEQAILDAQKAGDEVALKAAMDRWKQERFARGFELYLYEGKAPSKSLRAVFRRFKMFLGKIYRFLKSAGGKPSAEVEAVMGRMLASQEEIAAAELDDRFRPIENVIGVDGMKNLFGENVSDTYQKWLDEARADAEDRLLAEVMKDLKKEARREFRDVVDAERTRKREELEREPVYLAEAALKSDVKGAEAVIGHWFKSMDEYREERAKRKGLETELMEHMDAFSKGLEEKLIQSHMSEENITKAMQSPESYHRRVALEMVAMREKDRLIRNINATAMQGVEDAIKDAPEDVNLQDKSDAAAKIMEAIRNLQGGGKWTEEEYKTLERMIRATGKKELKKELKKLQKKTFERVQKVVQGENEKAWKRKEFDRKVAENDRLVREQARLILADRPIGESANVNFFRRQERMHARNAAKALEKEQWNVAYAEREQQVLASACALEAAKNEKKVEELKRDIQKKLGARTVRIASDERYWLHHIAYLLGLKANDMEKPEGVAEIGELFSGYKENIDLDADAPTEIIELLKKEDGNYKKMTVGEFTQAVNMLKVLYTIGRDKNRMLSMDGKDFADVVHEILASDTSLTPEDVVQHPVSPDTGGTGYSEWLAKIPGIGEQMAALGQKGSMHLMKPEVQIRLLGEEAHKYLYGTYERAQMRESELLGDAQMELERILSVYSKKERMGWKDRNIDVGGDKLSKENILCLALNWGTETNFRRVMDGIGQKLDVHKVLTKHMTERDWNVVQQIWDLVDTFWKETAEVEEKLNGSRLGKVPASPFQIKTADGKEISLRGGYYPLKYNAEKSARAQESEVEEQAKKTLAGARVFGTGRSHTKERSKHDVHEPLLLEFRVLQDHVYNASHNIAFRIAARDVHRIVRNSEFKQHVVSTYGMPFWKSLDQWVLDTWAIAADGSTDQAASDLSRTMAAFRRNSTMAIMGWRMWPVIENASNIGPMMDKLGAVETNAAIADYYSNKSRMDDLLNKSIFMRDRMNNMERDLRNDKRLFDPTYAPVEFLRDNAYWALAQTDLMLSKPLWCRTYKNAFPETLAAVNRENELNKRTYQAAQDEVSRLRAEVYDLKKELAYLQDEQSERKQMNPEAMRGSEYAGWSDYEVAERIRETEERIAEREKAFYEAGFKLERASELPILEGREIINEAELRAVQKADEAVRDVFGSGQTKDLAAIQRSRNEAVKMFTSFYSFFNTQFNAILEAHFKGKYDAHGYKYMRVWMPLARSILLRIVLVSFIGSVLKSLLGLEGDDEKDKYRTVVDPKTGKKTKVEIPLEERFAKVLGKNLLSTATGTLPGVRDFAGLIGSAVFDGTTYGRNFELGSVITRGAKQVQATIDLMVKKGEAELEREEKEAAERAKLKKMTKKQRKAYEEAKKYKKPKKEVGYVDVARSAAQAASTFTAARYGVTNTLTDGVFSIAQFVEDMMETDNYYDPDIRNVLRSVFFDKKLRAKEPPPKPPKKEKKKGRR
ncbi:hypothetical protein TAMA11512_09230 [Selenomonas sp. TAMA-11512]|uniref:hypothetical protein n=1 Tax=Selenomonas sp. TAMA-11512 TaxID=3095337 RepID=UPI00308E4BA5|nr:hypothetical protein TAMA11512_09230 [Selenomonas sp. TAMA-11512]